MRPRRQSTKLQAQVTPPAPKQSRRSVPALVADRVRELMREMMEKEPYRGRGAITRLSSVLNLSQPAVSQILSGGGVSLDTAMAVAELAGVDPRELVGGAYVGVAIGGRFPNLEICLAYHPGRWSKATEAAARAGAWTNDAMAEEWSRRLDALEAGIKDATRPGPAPSAPPMSR